MWKERRTLPIVTKFNTNLATCFSTSLSTYCCPVAGSFSLCKLRFLLRCWNKWLPYISFSRTVRENTVPTNRTPKRGNTAFWSTLGNADSSSGGGCMNTWLQIRRKIPDCLTERNLKKKKLKIKNITCWLPGGTVAWLSKLLAFIKRWRMTDYSHNCITEHLTNWMFDRMR